MSRDDYGDYDDDDGGGDGDDRDAGYVMILSSEE